MFSTPASKTFVLTQHWRQNNIPQYNKITPPMLRVHPATVRFVIISALHTRTIKTEYTGPNEESVIHIAKSTYKYAYTVKNGHANVTHSMPKKISAHSLFVNVGKRNSSINVLL